jgi:hypothetical protein
MRKLILFLSIFLSFSAVGQVYQLMPQYGYNTYRMNFDSTLTIPTVCGVPTLKSNILRKSAIAFDTCNNRFYYYNSKLLTWDTIKSGQIDTSSLSNRINNKLSIGDTSSMLSNYAKTSAVNLKLNISDTASMLSNYRKIDSLKRSTDSVFALKNGTWLFQFKDSVGNTSGFVPYTGATQDVDLGANKLSAHSVYVTGTNGNGHIHLKHQNADATATGQSTSLYANSNGDLKWKNDNQHYTTLKTQQTADRIYSFQNKSYTLADSSDVTLKLNISDTSTMLSKYLRKIDTASLSSRIDLRIKYTDSSSMLSPYLRKIDTASLSSRIDAKFTLPTLTSGSVLFSNGTTISQSNSRLFWDNTNNRLGIGTASPSTPIHVNATLTASSALARLGLVNGTLTAAANNDVLVGLDISPTFSNGAFTGVGNYPLRIGGHIGIGTANAFGFNYANFNALTSSNGIAANFTPNGTPTGLPYVFQFNKTSGTTNVNALLFVGGGSAGTGNSANKHVISSTADGSASSQPIVIRAASTGTNWGSVNDHLTVFATGNVVIQNASASATDAGYRLDVNGTVRSTQFYLSALNTAPATSSSTGTTGEIRIDASYIYICTATNTWKRVAIATW